VILRPYLKNKLKAKGLGVWLKWPLLASLWAHTSTLTWAFYKCRCCQTRMLMS
jgi:hypothetical protein